MQLPSQRSPQVYSIVPAILPLDQLFGPLFHDVQMQHVFEDSIIFADGYPKRSSKQIMKLYEIEKHRQGFQLKDFVHSYFHLPSR